jgi:hypothetical protein
MALNQTQCNLPFYERLKNFWRDAARFVGDRNGEKRKGARVSRLHSTHLDFECIFLPKNFFDCKFKKECGNVTVVELQISQH